MTTLRIRLFGVVDIRSGGHPISPLPTQKSKALLCFLLLHRDRRHCREILSDMFWPTRAGSEARRCLRTELWRVHSILEQSREVPRGTHVVTEQDQVGFNANGDYWLDVAEFEEMLDKVQGSRETSLAGDKYRSLTEAIALYRGDLLEDIDYEWCLFERQRLKARALSALERLLRHHETRREWDAVVDICYQLLGQDPLLEHVHRELMRSFYLMGNRSAALRQFEICSELLAEELDVEPMVETLALYRKIKRGGDEKPAGIAEVRRSSRVLDPRAPARDLAEKVLGVLADLNAAGDRLDRARGRLRGAIRVLEPHRPPRRDSH